MSATGTPAVQVGTEAVYPQTTSAHCPFDALPTTLGPQEDRAPASATLGPAGVNVTNCYQM